MTAGSTTSWSALPADRKLTKSDGSRWVLVWDAKLGTVLAPWGGAK